MTEKQPEESIAEAAANAATDPVDQTPEKPALNACPCGKVPGRLILEMPRQAKYGNALGDCCGMWGVEFRNGYTMDQEESVARATEAWNSAPRAGD